MATKASGTLSDDELLGGSDEDEAGGGDGLDTSAAGDGGDGGDDGLLGGAQDADGAGAGDGDDDIQFVIQDGDESGQDVDAAGDAAAGDGHVEALNTDAEDLEDDAQDPDAGLLTADEKKNYSQTVQKRIMRERRLKRDAEGRAEQESLRAQEATARALTAEKMAIGLLEKVLTNDIAAKTAELKAAKESADTDAEIKANGELNELQGRLREVKGAKERLEKVDATSAAANSGGDGAAPHPNLGRWLARNRWMGNPKEFGDEIAFTHVIDRRLAADHAAGKFSFAPNTVEYFAELDRRINRAIPTLRSRTQRQQAGGGGGQPRPAQRSPVAGVSRTASASSAAGSGAGRKVVLTREDLKTMQTFGLDPKNSKHLAEFARQKRQPAS